MKEKIKHLIAEHLIRKGNLKVTLRNLEILDELTEDTRNRILDELNEIEKSIQKLKEILAAF